MFKGAICLLEVIEYLKTIKGRKKFQKIIYLLGIYGVDIPYKYTYHHYGPYSAQLQEEIEFLVHQNFLEEVKQNGTYLYKITELGREFKKAIKENYSEDIFLDYQLLTELNNKPPQFLELLSTYAYLIENGYDVSSAREKTFDLKPHLSHQIEEVIGFYNSFLTNCTISE